jgi:hypothetical protein
VPVIGDPSTESEYRMSPKRTLRRAIVGVTAVAGSLALAAPAFAAPTIEMGCDPGLGLASCWVQSYSPSATIAWTINGQARPDLNNQTMIGDPCVLGTAVHVKVQVTDSTGTSQATALVRCQLFVP